MSAKFFTYGSICPFCNEHFTFTTMNAEALEDGDVPFCCYNCCTTEEERLAFVLNEDREEYIFQNKYAAIIAQAEQEEREEEEFQLRYEALIAYAKRLEHEYCYCGGYEREAISYTWEDPNLLCPHCGLGVNPNTLICYEDHNYFQVEPVRNSVNQQTGWR